MKQAPLIDEPRTEEYCNKNKLRIELPYPPSVNSATQYRVQLPSATDMRDGYLSGDSEWKVFWKWLRGKAFVQTYKTQETKDFKLLVWSACNRLHARQHWKDDLRISMHIHPPDRRRRDSSNLWKMTEDALMEAGVFEDDSQLKEHHAYMLNPVKDGLVIVEIEVL